MKPRQPIPPKATFEGLPFERFVKTMRALIHVPKKELDEILEKEKAEKRMERFLTKPR